MSKRKAVAFIAFLLIAAIGIVALVIAPRFLTQSSPLDKSIVKQFVYEIDPTYPPVAGLDVDLWNTVGLKDSSTTDASGYVTFAGLVDETYTIKWIWGGVEDSESQIIDCSQLVWDFGTNYLQSKSGGGLHLAEAWGQASRASRQVVGENQIDG